MQFYRRHLRAWHGVFWTVDGVRLACFDRNGAVVVVDASGMSGSAQKTYDVTVNHHAPHSD